MVVVVVEGATVRPFVAENTTMIVIGLILSVFGVGFLCWLLFMLAVYVLPFFVGMTAGLAAYHSGSGVLGALVVAFAAGAVTLVAGQTAFAAVRSPVPRVAIALLFATPAAIAGYHATLALARIGVPSASWREVFAVVGAIFVGGTAFVRVAAMATPPRCRTHWCGGAGSAADDGRQQTGVTQADPSASPLGGISVVGHSARPRTERRGPRSALPFQPFRAAAIGAS